MKQRWWVDGKREDALRPHLDVAAWMQPGPDRTLLSSDRQSAAVRIEGSPPLLVKWRRPVADKAHRTFLRPSRERREARAARELMRRGIETPQPWAVGELRAWGRLRGAVLLRAFETDAATGRERAAHDPDAIAACAAGVAAWHAAGFRHGDCYLKNILLVAGRETPQPIGFPKARFVDPSAGWDAARCKDLAQLAAGCTELSPPAAPFGWLSTYLAACGADLPAQEAEARIRPAFERVMARKRARVADRPRHEPHGPPAPEPLAPGTGARATRTVRPLEKL